MKHRLKPFFNLGYLWRLVFAIGGGILSSLAFPRENIPVFIFIAVILITLSVRGLKFLSASLIGFIAGLAFYLSQIEWLSLYLGPVPWLALSTLEALIFGLGLGFVALVWNWLDEAITDSNKFKTLVIAGALAVLWTAREWVANNLPYGGFPWSRLSQTQSETYLAKWVFLGGLGLLTFVIALISCIAALWVVAWWRSREIPRLPAAALLVAALTLPVIINPAIGSEHGSLTIGAVQGNAKAGLFSHEKPGQILQNHLDATQLLKEKSGYEKLDLVVWPENASDLSPFTNRFARDAIEKLVDEDLKVPLVFGTITERGDNIYNSSIFWKPQIGPTDWYDKKRPVPFAEFVPDRDFWYQLAPDLIGLVSRGYTFGERDGIFEAQSSKLGVLICFEIAIDEIGRSLVADGAQVILSQTNNADFGYSDETYQQAAFAKLRAIETGRYVVNVSTVGVSAIYAPNGSTLQQVESFVPAALLADVPLRTSITPAMIFGPWIDLMLNVLAFALIAAAAGVRLSKNQIRRGGEHS